MSHRALFCGLMILTLSACGGGGGGGGGGNNNGGGNNLPVTRTIGGSVTGLVGTLVLQNNGGDDLTLSADGNFTFDAPVSNGGAYSVTIATQPDETTCTVSNGSGSATANVTDVTVECVENGPPVIVGGTVLGLFGEVTLQNNGGDDIVITVNGEFFFEEPVFAGREYEVTVSAQPDGQTCSVADGSGTATDTPVVVAVTCVVDPPVLSLSLQRTKTFSFSWGSVPLAEYYQLLEDPTGSDGYTQIGANIPAGTTTYSHVVPLHARTNARYLLRACAEGCIDSAPLNVSGTLVEAVGFFKASNTGTPGTSSGDEFGSSVAISADGSTMAVGAIHEDSEATGIDGDQASNDAADSGAVYVFTRVDNAWSQQAYLKASNTGAGDNFGASVALSADGSTLVVGANLEDSNATDVGGNEINDDATDAGAAYVFTRSGDTWTQQAYLKASNTQTGDWFGAALAISGDGNILAVSAPHEDSDATGVNGSQTSDLAFWSGAVYVFARTGSSWTQQAYLKHFGASHWQEFGRSLALSADGAMLAVGTPGDDSAQRGIQATADYSLTAEDSGAVSVYLRTGTAWSAYRFIKASNGEAGDEFGSSVSLSGDGFTLAVGAPAEDGGVAGINGDGEDNTVTDSGAVYVFLRDGDFMQHSYVKASNPGEGDFLGRWHGSLGLASDGSMLVAGTFQEDGSSFGVNGPQNDDNEDHGVVYAFRLEGFEWFQEAYIKPPVETLGDRFGWAVALSADGETLAVGDYYEDSNATGVNGSMNNNNANASGCVYMY